MQWIRTRQSEGLLTLQKGSQAQHWTAQKLAWSCYPSCTSSITRPVRTKQVNKIKERREEWKIEAIAFYLWAVKMWTVKWCLVCTAYHRYEFKRHRIPHDTKQWKRRKYQNSNVRQILDKNSVCTPSSLSPFPKVRYHSLTYNPSLSSLFLTYKRIII